MGGPQNLGLYMGLMFALVPLYTNIFIKQVLLYSVFLIGGILSGSSAFTAFVLGSIGWKLIINPRYKLLGKVFFVLLVFSLSCYMYLQYSGSIDLTIPCLKLSIS